MSFLRDRRANQSANMPLSPVVSLASSSTSELLVLRGVRMGYVAGGRDGLVLEGVSLEVGLGEVVAVVGQRWEGKTTLLQLAAGMEIADAGEVRFEGRDFAVLSRGARAGL